MRKGTRTPAGAGYHPAAGCQPAPPYCKIADSLDEAPSAFDSVTVTDNTDDVLPATLKVCVSVNSLPYCGEFELPYHCVKSEVTATVAVVVVKVDPSDGENWYAELSTSRLLA